MKEQITDPSQVSDSRIKALYTMANRLRRHSLVSTSEAGSGHPSSCCSSAELVSAVFFNFLRFDMDDPKNPNNDRFLLSKGHAAPVLWAALAEGGAFPVERLLTLRRLDSDLEGHPTPRNPWVDAATGSLGQGLSIGLGMALASRLDQRGIRVYVLLGDGEIAEGAVWEAAALAGHVGADNLIALVDANRLGQSQATMYAHDLTNYADRFASCGWNSLVIDGHNVTEIIQALHTAIRTEGKPTAIIARTVKGKGISLLEDLDGWHGKPLKKGEELEKALSELPDLELSEPLTVAPTGRKAPAPPAATGRIDAPDYDAGKQIATREAYGIALRKLGAANPAVVALDGDVKNSTYSEKFLQAYPNRFFECFIAEQNMVGMAAGMSAVGKIPFSSTFACFLARAYDQIRMAGISQSNLKLCGSHAGVSIGEDGPSQMGLEDLAMMRAIAGSTVFYPSDAVSTERLVALAADTPGIVYIRTTRPKTPTLYSPDERFKVGGCKVLKSSDGDRVTIVGAGITLHEALKACEQLKKDGIPARVIDLYSIKPLDVATLSQAAQETGAIVTVEDHYPEGGLGEAVAAALAGRKCLFRRLTVNELPRSGGPEELMETFGIDAKAIAAAAREIAGG
jgi:transketolase